MISGSILFSNTGLSKTNHRHDSAGCPNNWSLINGYGVNSFGFNELIKEAREFRVNIWQRVGKIGRNDFGWSYYAVNLTIFDNDDGRLEFHDFFLPARYQMIGFGDVSSRDDST